MLCYQFAYCLYLTPFLIFSPTSSVIVVLFLYVSCLPPFVFLFPQPLTAPTVSICNEASTLLPLLLAFSSLSHNLLAAHSRHLTPLFIDLGTGGGGQRRCCVWRLGQYFHKGYLRPLPLSSSSTIPERHTAGS